MKFLVVVLMFAMTNLFAAEAIKAEAKPEVAAIAKAVKAEVKAPVAKAVKVAKKHKKHAKKLIKK